MLIVSPKGTHLLADKSLEIVMASIEVGNRSSFDGSNLANLWYVSRDLDHF